MTARKDAFDAALIPGFREAVATSYERLRSVEKETFTELLDEAGNFLSGAAHVRDCPLCGNTSSDAEELYRVHGMDIIRCRRCELVYSRQVIDHDRDAQRYLGTHVAKANLAVKANLAYQMLEVKKAEYVMEKAALFLGPPGRMLDIGCSTGKMLQVAKKHGWDPIGIEANAEAACLAREEALDVISGFFPEDMPENKESFDLITMLDVLEHAEEPVHLLKQVCTYLRPEGLAVIQVPNFDSLLIRLDGASNNNLCQGHWSYFTTDTLNKVAEEAGFTTVTNETIISELDRIMAFPPRRICETAKTIRGFIVDDTNDITADWIHEHFLGYKILAFYRKLS
jgi:2-polyprenyl-3-methyl-5-hydroxy-6-metoxy-1,4-benzoquinol methylase